MSNQRIRVGIFGRGEWALYGHIPTVQALDRFEIVALSGRDRAGTHAHSKHLGSGQASDSAYALIAQPNIDQVVVSAHTPEHGRLSKAAIAADKDVYAEWPWSTAAVESRLILAMAQNKCVKHVIGLQRRF
jgi:predicted dehydrogenase